jgi:dTDP-glucose pyrophosphorylase
MKAVVMAGGEGSRLRPLTIRRPKPMVPIAGKPVMEHILNLLKRHGITEVIVTVNIWQAASKIILATALSSVCARRERTSPGYSRQCQKCRRAAN